MNTEREKDWEGLPVPDGEKDDDVIDVWEVSPNLRYSDYDSVIIRSYESLLEYVGDNLDALFAGETKEELLERGTSIKFKLVKMTVQEYRGIVEEAP